MKKTKNSKGFTLIELLAVITIMGILLLVAIPAVSRTIENSRKETFVSNASKYATAVKNAILADELTCIKQNSSGNGDATNAEEFNVSSASNGTYIYVIDTENGADELGRLMESVSKSSWGNAHLLGYVKAELNDNKWSYYIRLTDKKGHGFEEEKDAANITKKDVGTYNVVTTSEINTAKKNNFLCSVAE